MLYNYVCRRCITNITIDLYDGKKFYVSEELCWLDMQAINLKNRAIYYYYYYYCYYYYYYKSMLLECHTVRKTSRALNSKKIKSNSVTQFSQRSNERLKSDVFCRRLKMDSDGEAVTSDGRLFQRRAAATPKARSPTVTRRVGGMLRHSLCKSTKYDRILWDILDYALLEPDILNALSIMLIKRSFDRAANSHEKSGSIASKKFVLQLIKGKCMPMLWYGLEIRSLKNLT